MSAISCGCRSCVFTYIGKTKYRDDKLRETVKNDIIYMAKFAKQYNSGKFLDGWYAFKVN